METARYALFFLVSVCLWKTSSASSIQLCTDGPSSFVNGTDIPAMLGQPVSVVFCVQCDPHLTIIPYINIHHPHRSTDFNYYYGNNKDVYKPIIVNITTSANKATINITIKAAQKEDFNDQFSVKLHTSNGVGDNSVFIFRLSDTATSAKTTSDADLIRSSQAKMLSTTSARTSPASSSTEMSTISSQASTDSTSTSSPTPEITQCWPHNTSLCCGIWYQVDNETCLSVVPASKNELPKSVCQTHGSGPETRRNIQKLSSCLTKIIGKSKGASNNYVVRVDGHVYFNVQSGKDVQGAETYSVVCFKHPLKVTFTASNSRRQAIRPGDAVELTCSVDGCPVSVTINRNQHLIAETVNYTHPLVHKITRVTCSHMGNYTCLARFPTGQEVREKATLEVKDYPLTVRFTASNSRGQAIRPGDAVELTCSVKGCPVSVTINRNQHLIAETVNYTHPVVHKITGVTCSHMGTYTCLAKSPSGKEVQERADLELKDCPVSLCESKDASREMTHVLGENVTFALCLMSSEWPTFSAKDKQILVKFTKYPDSHVNWTVDISMYNIQVKDYRTHTVRIENRNGGLDVKFTLRNKDHPPVGQKAQEHESESSAVLITLPPVCFIILVIIIVGIVWCRVKGIRLSVSRSEEVTDRSSCNDDSGEAMYANVKDTAVERMHEEQKAEHQQELDIIQCQEENSTADLHDQESGRFISQDGLVYITVVNANKQINKRSKRGKHPPKQKNDDEARVEYITLDFEKTGKLQLADEEENKDDDSGDKNDTRQ